MNIYHSLIIIFTVFLSSTACSANITLINSHNPDNTQDVQLAQSDTVAQNGQTGGDFSISKNYRSKLLEKGYSIEEPEEIDTSKLIDNMWQLKKFFEDKNRDIFTYTSLTKYGISSTINESSASLYSFHFDSQDAATNWFNVFDKTKLKEQIKISFSRPKKMLGLVGHNVILVEGYKMSDFKAFEFIVTNLDEVKSILDPKYTRPR